MKPERSEFVMIEDEEQKQTKDAVTPEIRQLIVRVLECAVVKLVGYLTRLWTPKVGGQEKGGEDSED